MGDAHLHPLRFSVEHHLVSGDEKPYQFLSGRQSMAASNSNRKKQENEKHAKHKDAERSGLEDVAEAAPEQHTGDIGEKGTITELETARDRRPST